MLHKRPLDACCTGVLSHHRCSVDRDLVGDRPFRAGLVYREPYRFEEAHLVRRRLEGVAGRLSAITQRVIVTAAAPPKRMDVAKLLAGIKLQARRLTIHFEGSIQLL